LKYRFRSTDWYVLASFSVRTRFRDNMIERGGEGKRKPKRGRARERRSDIIASTISQFKIRWKAR
jgi:hypothetical protein